MVILQAIETKYLGPTNTKGSRIKATCRGGSVTIGYRSELNSDENHALAAIKLAENLNWQTKNWTPGSVPSNRNGYVFVQGGK